MSWSNISDKNLIVNEPSNDGCLLPLSVSPHQLQDGYSNKNSSSGSQQCVSQPATPGGALPVPSPLSPSPASLSSYHGDDSDSISSPPWPLKTPSSPVRTRNSNTVERMSVQAVSLIDLYMTGGLLCNYFIKNRVLDHRSLSKPGLKPDMAVWD